MISVDLLVGFVTAHLADGVLEHGVLLEKMVDRHLSLSIVMHRTLEEETEEALCAVTSGSHGKVAQQHEVKTQRRREDRITAEEIDLDLHRIAHPAEDVDIVPSLLVVIAGGIIVDTHLVIILCVLVIAVTVEIRLFFGHEDAFESRKFGNLLRTEIGRLVKHKTVAIAENIGREPAAETQTTRTDDRSET